MLSDIHKQWLSVKAGMSLAAAGAAVPDDAADNNTAAGAWKWAGQEHANTMCVIHTDGDDAVKHSVHDSVVWQKNATWNSSISVQTAEEKAEQW